MQSRCGKLRKIQPEVNGMLQVIEMRGLANYHIKHDIPVIKNIIPGCKTANGFHTP